MNIKKVVKKINEFFDLSKKKQIKKNKKISAIREKLVDKKESIQKNIKKSKSKKDKENLQLELQAIKNLIEKASIE